MLPGDPLADVHQRPAGSEEAAVEAAGVQAGHEDGADHGEPDLAAVVVAREHQVDPTPHGAWVLVGRVAEQEAEVGLGGRLEVEASPPGIGRAPDRPGRARDVDLRPAPFEIGEARIREGDADPVRVVIEIVIAQDPERAEPAPEPREDGHDPVEGLVVVDRGRR